MCRKIKLADLSLCKQLENLRILYDTTLVHDVIDSATFLPKLKSFHSNSCLGVHSRLFEEKSSLVRLVLNCCHLGIKNTTYVRLCYLLLTFVIYQQTNFNSFTVWLQSLRTRPDSSIMVSVRSLSHLALYATFPACRLRPRHSSSWKFEVTYFATGDGFA